MLKMNSVPNLKIRCLTWNIWVMFRKNSAILFNLILAISILGNFLGCGKHDVENFGYTREVTPESGATALTWQDRFLEAVNLNKTDEVQALINEADTEAIDFSMLLKNGRTPLTHAVVSGSAIYVYWLLQKDIDVSLADSLGKTALDYAIELDKERVKLILDPNLQIQLQNEFYTAILADGEEVSAEVKTYLEAGVDPNFIFEETGETPLTQAIKIKSVAVLQILRWADKDFGLTSTDLELPNREGQTPLSIATSMNYTRVLKAMNDLLGASVNNN